MNLPSPVQGKIGAPSPEKSVTRSEKQDETRHPFWPFPNAPLTSSMSHVSMPRTAGQACDVFTVCSVDDGNANG